VVVEILLVAPVPVCCLHHTESISDWNGAAQQSTDMDSLSKKSSGQKKASSHNVREGSLEGRPKGTAMKNSPLSIHRKTDFPRETGHGYYDLLRHPIQNGHFAPLKRRQAGVGLGYCPDGPEFLPNRPAKAAGRNGRDDEVPRPKRIRYHEDFQFQGTQSSPARSTRHTRHIACAR